MAVGVMVMVSACSQLTQLVPLQPADDVTLPLYDTANLSGRVLYLDFVVARTPGDSGVPVGYSVSGDATYHAAGSLQNLPDTCTRNRPGVVVCDLGTEASHEIGTMTLTPGVGVPFHLGGPAFTEAMKAGTVYYGIEVLHEQARNGESLEITHTLLHTN